MKPQLPLTRNRFHKAFFAFFLLLLILLSRAPALQAQRDDPENIPNPDTVTIAGTLQTQLGCSGNWNTGCAETMLTYDPQDDLWTATFELTAGSYEYKAALNGTWDDNYGLNAEYYGPNIPLVVPADGFVTFWYNHKSRWVSDSINSSLVHLVGDFQSELGCAEDWQRDCGLAQLQDPSGSSLYQFITAAIPPGNYEVNLAFDLGVKLREGDPIPFTVGEAEAVIFNYDPAADSVEITTGDPSLATTSAPAAGMPAPAVAQ
ncbi:MAG: hypothetical protein IAE79_23410, partial [Anaerolinea sp.]|nr:hypothetical protein [Anaerolinea sp.]